eukprot:TRINITY_DN10732_c0_g1_i4.p1 TRINITY_DN10732_c0_g1~~TRINITY_DN10732_c0_g1_i4.p1  ORF type:complete len:362 (-),score=62.60 TRINITY_DN10732_c0_g1_i4:91-1137(-)
MAWLYHVVMSLLLRTALCMPALELTDTVVITGKTIDIKCELENSEVNLLIWKYEGRVLFAGDVRVRHDDRMHVMENILVIENVKSKDKGNYVCELETSAGHLKAFTMNLKVLVPPKAKIHQVGSQLTVKSGTSLALKCSGSGIPLPEVRWLRGGEVISRGKGEAGISLEYITRQDQGDIVCEAFNGVGETDVTTLTLDILFAPEVEMLKPQISFQPKCGMELQCLVHSSSSPTVQWFNNDLLLQPKDGVTMWSLDNLHVLQIHSCDQKILGQFTCKAMSGLGEDNMSVIINEQFVESRIVQELEAEERTNNVRRNVDQHHASPFVSSNVAKSSYSFLVCIVLALAIFL